MIGSKLTVVASGFSFLEGPRWHDGQLFVSDFYSHRVLAFRASGEISVVCTVPGQPSGLGFDTLGRMLVVSMQDRRLLRLENGELTEIADLSNIAGYHCNDMLVDRHGRAYVGNFGWDLSREVNIAPASLALVRPDGSISVAAEGLIFPNGIVVTDDGRTMLIAETFAARISAFEIHSDGSLANRRTWASFSERRFGTIQEAVGSGCVLPDGLCMDREGAVWVGDAGGRGVRRVEQGGHTLDFISTHDETVYAVALGGTNGRTLYMCAAAPLLTDDPAVTHRARLLACPVSVPGLN